MMVIGKVAPSLLVPTTRNALTSNQYLSMASRERIRAFELEKNSDALLWDSWIPNMSDDCLVRIKFDHECFSYDGRVYVTCSLVEGHIELVNGGLAMYDFYPSKATDSVVTEWYRVNKAEGNCSVALINCDGEQLTRKSKQGLSLTLEVMYSPP